MGVAGASVEMVIRFQIRRLDPLAGTASTDEGAGMVFEGWMELIGVIAELLASPLEGKESS